MAKDRTEYFREYRKTHKDQQRRHILNWAIRQLQADGYKVEPPQEGGADRA